MEVVGHGVDDDCPAEDIPDTETVCDKGAPCGVAVRENRREITGMRRMFTAFGVKMAACIREWIFRSSGAGGSLMDVESEHTMRAFAWLIRNAVKGPGNKNRVSDIIK